MKILDQPTHQKKIIAWGNSSTLLRKAKRVAPRQMKLVLIRPHQNLLLSKKDAAVQHPGVGSIPPLARYKHRDGDNLNAATMYRPKKFSDISEPFSQLSAREQQVVTLVCEGLSNRKIAAKLGVTEGTVKCHLHSIYEQLGVRSRIEIIVALADRRRGKA